MKPTRLYLIGLLLPLIPETRIFALKRWLYRRAGLEIGKNVRICSSVKILGTGKLSIGNNSWLGHGCMIVSTSRVKIGADVDIAPKVYIGTGSHRIDVEGNKIAGEGISSDVEIGEGSWLGAGSIVLPGVHIADHCAVAAGAVVTSDTQPYTLVGGVPAKEIKKLK